MFKTITFRWKAHPWRFLGFVLDVWWHSRNSVWSHHCVVRRMHHLGAFGKNFETLRYRLMHARTHARKIVDTVSWSGSMSEYPETWHADSSYARGCPWRREENPEVRESYLDVKRITPKMVNGSSIIKKDMRQKQQLYSHPCSLKTVPKTSRNCFWVQDPKWIVRAAIFLLSATCWPWSQADQENMSMLSRADSMCCPSCALDMCTVLMRGRPGKFWT